MQKNLHTAIQVTQITIFRNKAILLIHSDAMIRSTKLFSERTVSALDNYRKLVIAGNKMQKNRNEKIQRIQKCSYIGDQCLLIAHFVICFFSVPFHVFLCFLRPDTQYFYSPYPRDITGARDMEAPIRSMF